ncbi:hypothetical protein MNBD_BACTEROID03-1772 [hydrothermal vent metagenome]|uniref:Glycosyl hydrolase family 32 N-terminal domain-containing protein n=1 Tax=hydrothermal vent metagenome TaxID=652676 RepID=A0A3B0T7Z2_9ZZZZ
MITKSTVLAIMGLMLGIMLFGQEGAYPSILENTLIFEGDKCSWDADAVHTFSIVEANKGGYKYWAYYALDHYNERDSQIRKGGLARSNDLVHWEKYKHNPIISNNCRWPTVVFQNDTFYMFYAEYNDNVDSRIVMLTSKDGLSFEDKAIITPYSKGEQNQNPFIYFNNNDQFFYLFYYNGTERAEKDKKWNIYVKKSADILTIKDIEPIEVISSNETMAAPSVAFYNDKYYLLVEEFNDSKAQDRWVTNAFQSDKIDSGYKRVSNNPILSDNDACAFQYVFDNKLYVSYSHAINLKESIWNLRMIKFK